MKRLSCRLVLLAAVAGLGACGAHGDQVAFNSMAQDGWVAPVHVPAVAAVAEAAVVTQAVAETPAVADAPTAFASSPAAPAGIRSKVTSFAKAHGIRPEVAHAVIQIESRYNCNAYNRSSGATGIGQVLPATARGVGVRGNLRNCETGLEASMRYLRQAIDRHGDGCEGFSAYERGIYARATCSGYGRRVVALSRQAASTLVVAGR